MTRLLASLLLGAMLCLPLPAMAAPAEEEAAELWKLVDLNPNRAVHDAQQQLKAAQRGGDRAAQLHAWRILALAHNELLDMSALREDVEQGEPLARELGQIDAQCQFIAARGALARNAARYADSAALYEQAVALAQHHGRQRMLAGLYLDEATTSIEQGHESDALTLLVKAHALFEALQDNFGIAQTLDAMGVAAMTSKPRVADVARAIQLHHQALERLDPVKHRATLLTVHYNLGMAYLQAKDMPHAKQYLQMGLVSSREIEGAVGTAYYEYQLARIMRDEKHHAEAIGHLDRALPVFEKRGDLPLMVFSVSLTRAETLSLLGRVDESFAAIERVRALAAKLNSPAWDARFHEAAATVFARHGQYEKAYRALSDFGKAERSRLEAVNSQRAAELKTRFDVQQKETENALLRAQQQEASARRMVLFLALMLSLVVLGVLALYLHHQVRRSRRFAALAMRDELTGLPNRRSITEYARLQWAGRSAHEGKFRVALLDIDHFKAINDDFGHDVGDVVLSAFAQACGGKLRSSDRLGRYGGEEFLLIMPGSDVAQVPLVFSRLQQAVHEMRVAGLPTHRHVSFSMGVAEAWGEHDSVAEVIRRADEALYRAKQNGRNRCETAARMRLAAITPAPPVTDLEQSGTR